MAELMDLIKKRKEFETKIIAKALEDSEFRGQLLKNPKAVIEKETGKSLPEGLSISIVEEEPNTVKLVLPKQPKTADMTGELNDEALEQVAGGLAVDVVVGTGVTTGGAITTAVGVV